MVKVGILGVSGYAGAELLRIVQNHPDASAAAVFSKSYIGKTVSEIYPAFGGICDLECVPEDEVIEKSDVVFACLPAGFAQPTAKKCASLDRLFIDLGADFRLRSEEAYKQWYGGSYDDKELHEKAVYGLPELFREEIRGARLIANPGCYPTSAALGIVPALKAKLVDSNSIIIDAKSGATGAGRGLSQTTHFPDCNEVIAPYKIGVHRHIPEIEQTVSRFSDNPVKLVFTPHLAPFNRGIESTIYMHLHDGITDKEVFDAYRNAYMDEKFVRVREPGETACIRDVRGSNYCDVSLHPDRRTSTLIVVSVIDNLVKGAAGQAIQNMNISLGFKEDSGLCAVPA